MSDESPRLHGAFCCLGEVTVKRMDANKLADLAGALAAAGYRVVAPQRQGDAVRLAVWQPAGGRDPTLPRRAQEAQPGAAIEVGIIPQNSAKEFLLPHSEVIGRYKLDGGDFAPQEVAADVPKTVLLAVRPCDAAALTLLDAVFGDEYADTFYAARRAAATVVSVVCTAADEQCFCTSVGGAPDSVAGADAVLRSADGGKRFILEPLTEKGRALVAAAGATLAEGTTVADPPARVPEKFDAGAVSRWLADNFESPLWQQMALACLGCGACAFACPTCHCFDIQDEATRTESVRLRNWDTCALSLFTAHAGGHNPRPDQSARWRQRVMHKFRYMLDRLGRVGCTGCGRCARLCPGGMAIAEACQEIDAARKASAR
jgi:ferredoxin